MVINNKKVLIDWLTLVSKPLYICHGKEIKLKGQVGEILKGLSSTLKGYAWRPGKKVFSFESNIVGIV